MHEYERTCTHMHAHARTCTHMHAHARTCTHMHAHARTCTHRRTCIRAYVNTGEARLLNNAHGNDPRSARICDVHMYMRLRVRIRLRMRMRVRLCRPILIQIRTRILGHIRSDTCKCILSLPPTRVPKHANKKTFSRIPTRMHTPKPTDKFEHAPTHMRNKPTNASQNALYACTQVGKHEHLHVRT
jgi:hypothetical protein